MHYSFHYYLTLIHAALFGVLLHAASQHYLALEQLRVRTNFRTLRGSPREVSNRVWGLLCTYAVQCTHGAHDLDCSNIFQDCSGCRHSILKFKPSIDLSFHKLSNAVFQRRCINKFELFSTSWVWLVHQCKCSPVALPLREKK